MYGATAGGRAGKFGAKDGPEDEFPDPNTMSEPAFGRCAAFGATWGLGCAGFNIGEGRNRPSLSLPDNVSIPIIPASLSPIGEVIGLSVVVSEITGDT